MKLVTSIKDLCVDCFSVDVKGTHYDFRGMGNYFECNSGSTHRESLDRLALDLGYENWYELKSSIFSDIGISTKSGVWPSWISLPKQFMFIEALLEKIAEANKKHTIVIDGKTIEISAESFNNLKKSLGE